MADYDFIKYNKFSVYMLHLNIWHHRYNLLYDKNKIVLQVKRKEHEKKSIYESQHFYYEFHNKQQKTYI